ncbi:hypothetical protein LTV02_21935 [Nocardia yamanashiensis]|uniref:hypothetical protein n=1 Tax=Nocardia yamanashiensis TaxID=209247 RepID=UPI001E39557E|nr:hypothetical protein [Nocardia yamanashiensis]UGT38781.1 hypothetical protein LTV02_21935 [Nocardia yamanashiensis]
MGEIENALNKLIAHAQTELAVRHRRDREQAHPGDGRSRSKLVINADQLDQAAREVLRLHEREMPNLRTG